MSDAHDERTIFGAGGGAGMPHWIKTCVRAVDGFGRRLGRLTMYMVFAMMAVLFYSAVSKAFTPSLWTLKFVIALLLLPVWPENLRARPATRRADAGKTYSAVARDNHQNDEMG